MSKLQEIVRYENGNLYWLKKISHKNVIGAKVGNLCNVSGYVACKMFGKRYLVHRLIWMLHNGEIPKDMQIDHINGVKSDNRLENLRCVTPSVNSANKQSRCVYWFAPSKLWQVKVQCNYKVHLGGYYKTFAEAALAAKELKLKLFPELSASQIDWSKKD